MVTKEMTKIYDLVLNGPGMAEGFKLNIKLSRKHLVIICLLVENGINPQKERGEELAALLSKEVAAEMLAVVPEMLKKGGEGLYEFYERLKAF